MSGIILKSTSETIAIRGSSERTGGISEKQPLTHNHEIIAEEQLNAFDQAQTIGDLVEKLAELPDIRHDRVAVLRERIAAGEYHPASLEIADGILKDES